MYSIKSIRCTALSLFLLAAGPTLIHAQAADAILIRNVRMRSSS